MAVKVPTLRPAQNFEIANAIRGESGSDYRRRVPLATQATSQAVLQQMWNYVPARNEFIDALVNRIGLTIGTGYVYTNPLAVFKRGMLTAGDTIEEIAVGLAKAHIYDPNRDYLERDIFGQEPNQVQTSFHKITRQEWYKVTVNTDILQRAFLSDTGLWDFTAQLMASATNGDQVDELLQTLNLLPEFYKLGGFFKVQVPNILSPDSDEADAKAFLRSVRGMADTLAIMPSEHYNAAGMPVFVPPEKMVLFVTPNGKAAIDVEALAGAFNLDKTDVLSRVVVVPDHLWRIPGAQAILTSEDFFVIADTLISTTQAPNPVGLYNNYFFHHHSIISASRFVPAILFTTEAGDTITIYNPPVTDVTDIEVGDAETGQTVTQLQRGKAYVAYAEAVTTDGDSGVRYELVSKTNGPLSPRTWINQNGVLNVALDETSTAITIKAYATNDDLPQEVGTKDYNVVGTLVVFWPTRVVEDEDNNGVVDPA
jgi:hypothetical protein